MVSPWLPQNIQKKIFQYILSRLQIFSNINHDNIDVSFEVTQTPLSLSLKDVELDTEKLSVLSGLYVRHGKINSLDLKLAVLGGIRIDGSGINLIASLTEKILDDKDEITSLLARTTADLASSILISKEARETNLADSISSNHFGDSGSFLSESEISENSFNTGYGLGDFSGFYTKVADAAISQLNVVLRDINVRIILEDVTLDVVINTFKLSTNENGLRQVSISDFEWIFVSNEPSNQTEPMQKTDNLPKSENIDSLGSIYFEADKNEHNLSESVLFSHADANSLYMSAVSSSPSKAIFNRAKPKPRLLWCEYLLLSFPGLDFSSLTIELGRVNISLKNFPQILMPLIRFLENRTKDSKKQKQKRNTKKNSSTDKKEYNSAKPDSETIDKPGFNISRLQIIKVEISINSSMLPHGIFEDESNIKFIFENLDYRSKNGLEVFFDIGHISLMKSDTSIVKISHTESEEGPRSEFSGHIYLDSTSLSKIIKFAIPFDAVISLTTEDIFLFQQCLNSFQPIISAINNLSSSDQTTHKASMRFIGHTSLIKISLKIVESNIHALIFPLSFDGNGTISTAKAILDINLNNYVELRNLVYNFRTPCSPAEVLIESIHTKCNVKELSSIKDEFLTQKQEFEKSLDLNRCSLSTKPEKPVKGIQKGIAFTISIEYIELQITLPSKLQTLTVDVGKLNFQTSINGNHLLSVFSLHVSRDMCDVEEKIGYLSIIHNACEQSQNIPILKIRIGQNGIPQKVVVSGVTLEYHPKLLDLFQKSEADVDSTFDEPDDLISSISTIVNESIQIPVVLNDCVIGLSPLHLPSHGIFLIERGTANILIKPFGSILLSSEIQTASLYLVDDVKTQRKVLNLQEPYINHFKSSDNHHSLSGVKKQLVSQGYSQLSVITNISIEVSLNLSGISRVVVSISVESIYLKSCADSTHNLIQLFNDLKPELDLPPFEERYQINTDINRDIFNEIEENAFFINDRDGENRNFDSNADFICDDVPANLEFVESYYTDHSSRAQWASSPSGSLTTNYTNTDILLEQDLSELASQNSTINPSKVVDFNNRENRKLGSFEQRTKSHDSTLNITEDHFGKPCLLKENLKSTYSIHSNDFHSYVQTKEQQFASDITSTSHTKIKSGTSNDNLRLNNPSTTLIFDIKSLIWDLHDGFDWEYTRDIITAAVYQVEEEVKEVNEEKKRQRSADSTNYNIQKSAVHTDNKSENFISGEPDTETEQDEVVGGFLFNSIYIGMSTHQDSSDLRKRINEELNYETYSDTASQMSYDSKNINSNGLTFDTKKEMRRKNTRTPLMLERSKRHKVQILLKGVSGAINIFSAITDSLSDSNLEFSEYGGDKAMILNRIMLKIRDLEILDNVQTSTWNKFLTYMRSAGEREADANMIKLQIENVKPIPHIPTSEIVLNVQVLPLRLHVDQDTLDFITRFFEFKDDRFDNLIDPSLVELPFIQKVDVRDIPVKLDYKPKKVDYAGLRSGHTTEFMNFFILDEAEMVLRHTTLYGITGFPRMGKELNNIWMPDIKKNQLGDVLSGLAPVRSLVKIGSGIRDLVVVPVQEYKKDGRIVRGIQKSAWKFARNTSSEIVKFGAKIAVGTQTMLENAEKAMGGSGSAGRLNPQFSGINSSNGVDSTDDVNGPDCKLQAVTSNQSVRFVSASLSNPPVLKSEQSIDAHRKSPVISLYADQPRDVKQGLQSAYNSLGRNLSIAKNAVVEIKTEAVRSGSAQGAAIAVVKAAPIAIIRPMIGATEAVSRTLLGVTNQMDPAQLHDIEEKYRSHSFSDSADKR